VVIQMRGPTGNIILRGLCSEAMALELRLRHVADEWTPLHPAAITPLLSAAFKFLHFHVQWD
jgi:hypothetical protein